MTEGPDFNAFMVRDDVLLTPDSGVLDGMTRPMVFDRAVDDQAIGDGGPGPTTQRLAALYWSRREAGWYGTAIDPAPAEAGTTDTQQGKR